MRLICLTCLVVLSFFVGCTKSVKQMDAELLELYELMDNKCYGDISIEKVDSLLFEFEKVGDDKRVAKCNLIKGARFYSDNNFASALDALKQAELYIVIDDIEAGRLYYYLSRIFAVDNPDKSDFYARKLLCWAEEYDDVQMRALGNKLLMNIAEDKDSAEYYRREAIRLFSLVGDTLMCEKSNARFGIKFMYDISIDSVVNLVLPFYERVGYVRDADALATTYLLNGQSDKALQYIKELKGVKDFEFQYYNNMAVYYSQNEEFEKALDVYDSAFVIYQQQAKLILDEQIARVNGKYDKKLYDQQIELQRYRTMFVGMVFVVLVLVGGVLIVWLVRVLLHHKQRNKELDAQKHKLEEENVDLIDKANKQSKKLYAVSDICKNTYASVVLANPAMVKVISKSLYNSLKDVYPQLSNMDFTYMFLDFIGLNIKDICKVLCVQEGTYYCRRSAIKKKLVGDAEQDIDEMFEQFFLGRFIE